jgi:UDP-N-acetylglucosamine 2-epimerase (non-hydrolysing)
MKLMMVAGARPNFMKIAPISRALRDHPEITPFLVHTGQHYDEKMSDLFFRQLGLPEPDVNLEVRSGTHAAQTAAIMLGFEPLIEEQKPDAVLVVGDVNSTIACGLVAVKLGVPLIHVEAGLRSGDRTMPEEINRILTDAISDLLFCTEQAGVDNLEREGVEPAKIHLVGNVMIDTLLQNQPRFAESQILEEFALKSEGFAVLTLHRPSNVDNAEIFSGLLDALDHVQREQPVIFPVHPRTRARLAGFGFADRLGKMSQLRLVDPVGYFDFQRLISTARVVLTDSGGIQEETTVLGVPCLTLRANTERPATISHGSNRLVGMRAEDIIAAYREVMETPARVSRVPPLWDGGAAERIVAIIRGRFGLDANSAAVGGRVR